MNLGELKSALRRYGFNDEDPLDIWINASLHEIEIAAEWPFLFEPHTTTINAGVAAMTLPANFVKPVTVRDVTVADREFPLEYWDYRKYEREIEDLEDDGVPEIYTLLGTQTLLVWRVPASARNIEMVYRKTLADLVDDGDVPGLPALHHYTIVRGAAFIGLQAENEEERAITAQGQFENDLGKMLDFYALAELGEPTQVEDVQGYGVGYYG